MQYAVSVLPVVPLRSGASDKDEMVSQLVFGEYVTIIEKQQKWSFVEICHDGYQGWIYSPMILNVPEESALSMIKSNARILGNLILPVTNNLSKHPIYIPAGSSLYEYKPASNSFRTGDLHFYCQQEPFFYSRENIRENISQAALGFINIPYLWGGEKPLWHGLFRADADSYETFWHKNTQRCPQTGWRGNNRQLHRRSKTRRSCIFR